MAAAAEVSHRVAAQATSLGRQPLSVDEEAVEVVVEEEEEEEEAEQGRSSSSACCGHAGLPSTAESSAALISVWSKS